MKSLLAMLLGCVALVSCGDRRHWSERAAQDRIMLVRHSPETLGHVRLVNQATEYPDFARFLQRSGEPDFIAETTSDERRYMILYYLDTKEGFACRSWRGPRPGVEFAGPYPLAKKDTEVLRKLQDNAVDTTDSGVVSHMQPLQ